MLRRLFFLFPDEVHAQQAVDQLVEAKISERRIHAISQGKLKTLPEATKRQKNDTAFRSQSILWNVNLLVFAFATITFFVTLAIGDMFWIIATFVLMAVTFLAGQHFVVHIPDVHLTEFTDALAHGDILLMVDVPVARVMAIENLVHRRHPEATVGGVGRSLDALGI